MKIEDFKESKKQAEDLLAKVKVDLDQLKQAEQQLIGRIQRDSEVIEALDADKALAEDGAQDESLDK